jgi:hypothetical protein
MCDWQFLFVFTLYSDDKVDVFKTSNGHASRSSCESKQLLALIVIELIVNDFPEPVGELVVRV